MIEASELLVLHWVFRHMRDILTSSPSVAGSQSICKAVTILFVVYNTKDEST